MTTHKARQRTKITAIEVERLTRWRLGHAPAHQEEARLCGRLLFAAGNGIPCISAFSAVVLIAVAPLVFGRRDQVVETFLGKRVLGTRRHSLRKYREQTVARGRQTTSTRRHDATTKPIQNIPSILEPKMNMSCATPCQCSHSL